MTLLVATTLLTAGAPVALRVSFELGQASLAADQRDVALARIAVVDAAGWAPPRTRRALCGALDARGFETPAPAVDAVVAIGADGVETPEAAAAAPSTGERYEKDGEVTGKRSGAPSWRQAPRALKMD